jgi:hypothetical protein
MRFDYKGHRVGVEQIDGQWRAWVRRLRKPVRGLQTGSPTRTVVSGYGTEAETIDAVKRWLDKSP